MFIRRFLTFIFVAVVFSSSLNAQLFRKDYLTGRIIDDSTGNRLSWVHIFNESRREWYTSDGSGRFSIPISVNDTLVFSSVGFLGKVFIVERYDRDSVYSVRLRPRLYHIEEVAIRGYRNYEGFRQEFKTYRVPVTELDGMRSSMQALAREEGIKAYEEKKIEETLQKGIDGTQFSVASIPILSREEKFMLRYKNRLEEEEIQRQIDKKYNREIVAVVSKLPEEEITDFMVFCDFSKEFLSSASELDIIYAIKDKLILYQKLRKSGDIGSYKLGVPLT